MRALESVGNFLASPAGLFIHIGLLLATTALLIYKPLTIFRSYESGPILESRPPHEMENIPEVEVGFTLENFSKFNINDNEFTANGIVWFIYDPKTIDLEKLSTFSFNKAKTERSNPVLHRYGDKMLARYFVKLEFSSNLEYQDFPLDDHRIFLVFNNESLTSKSVRFTSSKRNVFVEPDHMPHTTWKLVDFDVQTGYDKITLKERKVEEEIYFSNVIFSFDYDRVGIHLIMLILIPLLFIFFVALSMFFLETKEAGSTFRGTLFSLVGFLFVLETISPPAGYLTLADYVYFSIFLCSFFVITLSWLGEKFGRATRGIIGTLIEIGLIGLLTVIFQIWRG